jgi:hypothetical protein
VPWRRKGTPEAEERKRLEEEAKETAPTQEEERQRQGKARAEAMAKEAEEATARKLKLGKRLARDAGIAKVDGKTQEAARLRQAAQGTFEDIVTKYPKTKVAEEARELLEKQGLGLR